MDSSKRSPNSRSGSPVRPSSSGRPAGGSHGSPTRQTMATNPNFPPSMGYDPARDDKSKGNKRLDLPAEAYMSKERMAHAGFTSFTRRPGFNNTGSTVNLEVNQFRAKSFNQAVKIYQFDVSLSPDTTKTGVIRACWENPALKERLKKYKGVFIHDGAKLAWSNCPIDRGEERMELDANHDLPPLRVGKRQPKMIKFTLRQTSQIDLSILNAYLTGQTDFNTKVLEALNFLDHVIRQGPSERLVSIKRNFYPKTPAKDTVFPLSTCLECVKGVYASVRLNQSLVSGKGFGLGMNIDVANTAFYIGGQAMPVFIKHFIWMSNPRLKQASWEDMCKMMRPVRGKSGKVEKSDLFKILLRLKRLKFTVTHRGKEVNPRPYTVHGFDFHERYGSEGATAKNVHIEDRESQGKSLSVYDFYQKKYNYRIQETNFPLVLTERAGSFPICACKVERMQRYPYKLDADSTAAMIKAAVTRPQKRYADIMAGKSLLKMETDNYLQQFGINFETQMSKTTGRLLPPPRVQFANGYAEPKLSGRWDLKGKKFLKKGLALKNWGIVILGRACQPAQAKAFIDSFRQIFTQHGMDPPDQPVLIEDQKDNNNTRQAIVNSIKKIAQTKGPCQMLFVVVRRPDAQMYEHIKAAAECENGVLTQVVLSKNVEKNQAQYHSNVAMKVNSKLGGTTCRVPNPNKNAGKDAPAFFTRPTMIIGADVTHAPPGEHEYLLPSITALTMSMDRDAARYNAFVESNGFRIEMVQEQNMRKFLDDMFPKWLAACGGSAPPQTIYYFRDGVSEGQFAFVLEQEVTAMKKWFREKHPQATAPKITVIVATKRHHIRMFPAPGHGDKNNNPNPGTLLENVVCHPFQWDFYLNSHSAIQGTARPVHYHVLMDENNCKPEALQGMIYGQCYQYARSTTPVSLHPAIYYADIAAARARSHEDPRTQIPNPKFDKVHKPGGSTTSSVDVRTMASPPLLQMGDERANPMNKKLCNNTMWFI